MRLIDADELKRGLCAECTLYPDKCLKEDCDWDSIYHIDHAPTIEAEPIKHGAWIKITQEWVDDAEYLCSCCGRKIKAPSVLNPAWAFPYCHCGARMDGIDDGTN